MKPVSILGRAIILVAVPSLVLLGLLAAFTAAQRHQAEAQRWSLHTTRVLESSQQLVAQLVEAQSGIRGFVIARDAVFLDPYREARQRLPVLLEHVRAQTRDNPEQHARAVNLSRQATQVLAYYEGVLAAADAGALTHDGERSVVVRGKALVDQFKAAVGVFRDAEQRLDDERREAVSEARSRLLAVVVIGTGAALFAVIALGVWFHRSISQRVQRLTETARALSHGNAAPADDSADEFGAVDVALREMAAALASRQRAAVGALADAVSLFSAAASRRAVLDVAADRALALAGAGVSLCTLAGDTQDSQAVVAAAVSDRHPSSAPAPGAPFTWDVAIDVMRTGRPIHLTALDRRGRPGPPDIERVLGSGEWIGVPLSDDRHTPIGVLQVASLPGQTFRPDDGDVVGMLAQAASVALELQRSRQRLESLNADLALTNQENELFIYSVSHDLRSPLVNLEGFSRELTTAGERLRGLLVEPGVPDDTRNRAAQILDDDIAQSLHFIRVAVGRLAAIIDGLLRLSRAGRVEYRRQSLAVDRIVQRIVDAMQSTLAASGAEVHLGPLPHVLGDALAIEQLFANLIGNAVAYGRPGVPPRVDVTADETLARNPRFTVVRVTDNGLGIPEAHLDKVFQPLQRLHAGVGRGEGMGLAIVKRIVERHEGRVWVRSETGVGTTFYVELPKDIATESANAT